MKIKERDARHCKKCGAKRAHREQIICAGCKGVLVCSPLPEWRAPPARLTRPLGTVMKILVTGTAPFHLPFVENETAKELTSRIIEKIGNNYWTGIRYRIYCGSVDQKELLLTDVIPSETKVVIFVGIPR